MTTLKQSVESGSVRSSPKIDFYIPATSSILERRPRTLKDGDTFAVFDHYGDVVEAERSPEGIYHRDTRYLSRLSLTLDNQVPLLLSSTLQDDNSVLTVDLANPDIYRDGRLAMSRETLHVIRTKFLWRGCCYERIAVRNFSATAQQVHLRLGFAADFVDLFEVRGLERRRRGNLRNDLHDAGSVNLRYRGLDAVDRVTRLEFNPAPAALTGNEAIYDLSLDPNSRVSLFVTVRCLREPWDRTELATTFHIGLREARRALHASTSRAAIVDSSNALLNRLLCRSVADLYMLVTDTPQGSYPYAGIPWFSTAFGRDGIITALEMLWFDPTIAKGVLGYLAATQSWHYDPETVAEPGKIMHEMRLGEMAGLGEVPFGNYYGTVDATPLFVVLAGRYLDRTGDLATVRRLWPNIEAALRWIDTDGDLDRDGFVEYLARGSKGLTNQGWKDSNDAVSYDDGALAGGAIALCEVQAYVYAAKREASKMYRALGDGAAAANLDWEAANLRERFEAAFWCEDLGTYALALDGDKRPCRVRTSNAGHALFAGIADPERAKRLVATLFGRASFSGWGIRTLASGVPRYNPMSYHNGSIWPHDNAIIALGLARYGYKAEAARLFGGLFDAVKYMDLLRPPELFCGFSRRRGKGPTLYPVACSPQAWASAAPFAFLEACLGLHCDHDKGEIRLERPELPAEVDEIRIRRLRLGDGSVDLLLRRHASDVSVNVTARHGDVRVVVVN